MSLSLSSCALFILLMQSVNKAQLLNITFSLTLPLPAAAAVNDTVPLTSIYLSL